MFSEVLADYIFKTSEIRLVVDTFNLNVGKGSCAILPNPTSIELVAKTILIYETQL